MGYVMKEKAIKLKDLKVAYEKAVEENKEEFVLEGFEFYREYAKYLIEYIEHRGFRDEDVVDFTQK